jgi:glyoxylate/hydroxypyruvate reductase A
MSNSVLLVTNDAEFTADLRAEFARRQPQIQVLLPGDGGADQATMAACWYPDEHLLSQYPNLKCLHSVAAGVDHLGTGLLSSGLPICRIVDENQKQGMLEYVLWGVLNRHRNFDKNRDNQMASTWHRYPQQAASELTVSVLGLGALGQFVAEGLAQFGYQVAGWSRSQKNVKNIACYSGSDGLKTLLSRTDILVNLLPLSSETKGILSQGVFDSMPKGGYLINCGRGGHMVREDLVNALESGQLRGALLDVFDTEPLPKTDAFWQLSGVVITPHVASDVSLSTIIDQVAANVMSFSKGVELTNTISSIKGY